jgi:hypothetical protein
VYNGLEGGISIPARLVQLLRICLCDRVIRGKHVRSGLSAIDMHERYGPAAYRIACNSGAEDVALLDQEMRKFGAMLKPRRLQ